MINENFYTSKLGSIIPMCSASVSILSSALILNVIVRSRINSTYHQIMFFMSSWDIIFSLSIGLTSIPMPIDVIYPFKGPKYGNVSTCEIQAFAFILGAGFTLSSNMFLNIYYLCTIRYQVREEKFQKYAWPLFLIMSTTFTMWLAIKLLLAGYLNPTPYESFCMVGTYPHNCNGKDIPCLRGDFSPFMERYFSLYVYTFIGIQVLILFSTMILIVYTFHERGRLRFSALSSNEDQYRDSLKMVITRQAMMYIIAFMLSWAFSIISFMRDTVDIAIAKQIFQPLQGFFNAMIFMYHKVFNLRRWDQDLSLCEALRQVLINPEKEPRLYFSSISLVEETVQIRQFRRRLRAVRGAAVGGGLPYSEESWHSRDNISVDSGGFSCNTGSLKFSSIVAEQESGVVGHESEKVGGEIMVNHNQGEINNDNAVSPLFYQNVNVSDITKNSLKIDVLHENI